MMQVNNINYIVHVVICITRYYVKKKEKIIWEFMIIDLCSVDIKEQRNRFSKLYLLLVEMRRRGLSSYPHNIFL